jgi:hypothetical protein
MAGWKRPVLASFSPRTTTTWSGLSEGARETRGGSARSPVAMRRAMAFLSSGTLKRLPGLGSSRRMTSSRVRWSPCHSRR